MKTFKIELKKGWMGNFQLFLREKNFRTEFYHLLMGATLMLSALSVAADTEQAKPIKIGVYSKGYGAQGVFASLKDAKNINAVWVEKSNLGLVDLLAYDVVVIGSLTQCPQESMDEALQEYVKCGGGLILNHVSCALTRKGIPIFPEIISRAQKQLQGKTFSPLKIQHPILDSMPKQYEHAYNDHFNLTKGPKGEILVLDSQKIPVVLCGSCGAGRVVANGALTGLTADNKDAVPTDGELQLLLNAVKWAGEGRISSIPEEERNKRTAMVQKEKDAKKIRLYDELTAKQYDWFDESMLRCSFIQRQPIEKTSGRFFLIARVDYLNQFGYERTRQNLRQLKLMGITDIIQLTLRDCVVFHPTTVKNAIPRYTTYDPLMVLVQAAAKEGMGVWMKLQIGYGQVSNEMLAIDSNGVSYRRTPDTPDVLNKEYRRFLCNMIEEYATKYNIYKSVKGFYVDMPQANIRDYLGDNMEDFKKFTMERFGEKPPQDCNIDKLANSCDPSSIWWRRWMLFRQWVNEDFNTFLADYCRSKGLEFAIQTDPTASHATGWAWGTNPYRLSNLAQSSWVFTYPGRPYAEMIYALDQSTSGTFAHGSWGNFNTRSLRGHRAGLDFPFIKHCWRPCTGGMTSRGIDALRTHILNCREWSGGKILAKAALLNNQNSLLLQFAQNSANELQKESAFFEAMSHYLDMDCIMIENTELYDRYSVLVVPPYDARGLSQELYDKLKQFVQRGGIILNLNAKWSVSKADLTEEKDMTSEFTGSPVLETFKTPKPETLTAAEKDFGKGRVVNITSHDVLDEIKKGNIDIEKQIGTLLCKLAEPSITLKSNDEPRIKIMTTLKKNNWIAVTLWSDDKTPAHGIVSVDLPKLGLQSPGYRLLLYGRNMELFKPGDANGGVQGRSNFWTAEDFKAGVAITILKNDEMDLQLPSSVDLSAYSKQSADFIKDFVIPNFNKSDVLQRQYGHEIMVIAPADELNIDGEKAD